MHVSSNIETATDIITLPPHLVSIISHVTHQVIRVKYGSIVFGLQAFHLHPFFSSLHNSHISGFRNAFPLRLAKGNLMQATSLFHHPLSDLLPQFMLILIINLFAKRPEGYQTTALRTAQQCRFCVSTLFTPWISTTLPPMSKENRWHVDLATHLSCCLLVSRYGAFYQFTDRQLAVTARNDHSNRVKTHCNLHVSYQTPLWRYKSNGSGQTMDRNQHTTETTTTVSYQHLESTSGDS